MSFQTKAELESWWETTDPWGYTTNDDDIKRRDIIIDAIRPFAPYERALDIGAGEGFITSLLPASSIDAIEISDKAAQRLPKGIRRVKSPIGKYDLIIATGVLYDQYDWKRMKQWIEERASGIILLSHYDKAGNAHDSLNKKLIMETIFPYREGEQRLKVYQC